jgi:Dolichyl-phosphate-mannose-protein mannosyltransferase
MPVASSEPSALRRDALVELAVAAAVLVVWTVGLGTLAGWKPPPWTGQSTDLWPFYVRTQWLVQWHRAIAPLGAFALTFPILRAWMRRRDGDPLALLAGLTLGAFVFHLACGMMQDGFAYTFGRPNEYWNDVRFVDRHFLSRFPEVGSLSQHGETHPPGITLLLALVQWLGFTSIPDAEAICASFAALTALPLYGAARRLYGDETARTTVALFLFAGSVSAFAVLAMDCFTMLLATLALYGLALALDGKWWGGILCGLAFAAATFCHYLAFSLGVTWAAIVWSRRRRIDGRVLVALALAVVAFAAFYADLVIGFHYRPLPVLRFQTARFAASPDAQRDRLHFAVGSPIAFLGALGLPLFGLVGHSLGGALRRIAGRRDLDLALVVIGASLPWLIAVAAGKPRGEVEHVFMMFVPTVVLAASAAAQQWYARGSRWVYQLAVPLLVAQAIAVELSFNTFW